MGHYLTLQACDHTNGCDYDKDTEDGCLGVEEYGTVECDEPEASDCRWGCVDCSEWTYEWRSDHNEETGEDGPDYRICGWCERRMEPRSCSVVDWCEATDIESFASDEIRDAPRLGRHPVENEWDEGYTLTYAPAVPLSGSKERT